MKLTKWFPPEVKPVRKGVYQVKINISKNVYFSYYNGTYFCSVFRKKELADKYRYMSVLDGKAEWRGLAEKP